MQDSLEGKTAIVTGASRGIGKAAALALAGAGANIVGCDLDGLDELADELGALPIGAHIAPCDVSSESAVIDLVETGRRQFGTIDVVVNNAGIGLKKSLLDTTSAEFDRIVSINFKGVFLMGRSAIAAMRETGGKGRVINIASELGFLGRENNSVYCATKGAVITLTRSWAREFAPDVLVNAIAPGPVDTDLLDLSKMTPEQAEKEKSIPLGRIGRPDEIADAVVFLAGPRSTFVTGQVVGVNGGAAMY